MAAVVYFWHSSMASLLCAETCHTWENYPKPKRHEFKVNSLNSSNPCVDSLTQNYSGVILVHVSSFLKWIKSSQIKNTLISAELCRGKQTSYFPFLECRFFKHKGRLDMAVVSSLARTDTSTTPGSAMSVTLGLMRSSLIMQRENFLTCSREKYSFWISQNEPAHG